MFEVKVLVEDKYLPKVLWALDVLKVFNLKVVPVRAAKAKKGEVVSTQPMPGATIPDQVGLMIQAIEGAKHLPYADMSKLIVDAGGKPSSMSYVAKTLQKRGIIGKGSLKHKAYPIKRKG